jgi:galactose-1-phosphate uridylyltransferase
MNLNNCSKLAKTMASKAKPGVLKLGNDVYTFEFNQATWDYVVYKNLFEYVTFATKDLKQAKQWLLEYLNN